MRKIDPPDGYPPEDGRYLRGKDYSPVAVVAILNQPDDQIPERLKEIVKESIETGAVLVGMLQTENIGIEKIIANVISNPNIRYIVLCGIESRGHLIGDAFIKLFENGLMIGGASSVRKLQPHIFTICPSVTSENSGDRSNS